MSGGDVIFGRIGGGSFFKLYWVVVGRLWLVCILGDY